MLEGRRLIIAGALGSALIIAAVVSDLIPGHFWERHALFASILGNVLVLAVTLAVVNELLERRDRRRWQLLAQRVMFARPYGICSANPSGGCACSACAERSANTHPT